VNVSVGSPYTDLGATANDNVDGDITANIITVNPVDINTISPYTVTYNVTDAAGNIADEVTRTVNVVAASSVISTDSFDSGDLTGGQNGFKWAGGNGETPIVTNENPRTGTYSLKFPFDAQANGNSWSEQRFDLGGDYPQIYIRYWLYIPDGTEPWGGAAYVHRGDIVNNNKFLRIWDKNIGGGGTPGYDNGEKMGCSFRAGEGHANSGISWMLGEYDINDNQQTGTLGQDAIVAADLGTWVEFKTFTKIETSAGAGDGELRLWKNGVQIGSMTGLNNFHPASAQIMNNGYILGWANSGFVNATNIFIDDITFSDTDIV